MRLRVGGATLYHSRNSFLVWISVLDAAATLTWLLLAAMFAAKARRFIRDVDASAVEVADYAIIVQARAAARQLQLCVCVLYVRVYWGEGGPCRGGNLREI